MNDDRSLTRVAIRTSVLPELERLVGRGVRAPLARSAALLRRDADYLSELSHKAGQQVVRRTPDVTTLAAGPLRDLPAALATRVVRRALMDQGVVPEAEHVHAVVALSDARSGARVSLPAGLQAWRASGYVRIGRPSPRP